jgi:hypothetical protein
MVIEAVALTAGQPPLAGKLFVTVYVPGVLAARLICPVEVLTNTSPEPALNVPADPPLTKVGDGLVAFWQYGDAV